MRHPDHLLHVRWDRAAGGMSTLPAIHTCPRCELLVPTPGPCEYCRRELAELEAPTRPLPRAHLAGNCETGGSCPKCRRSCIGAFEHAGPHWCGWGHTW